VQFEKDIGDDPFDVAALILEVEKGANSKRYGIQEHGAPRAAKRVRVEDDSD
jgi:hypothetical protein